jgi:site-specific DNA-methyltransferase (adenine-specific)
MKQEIIQGDCLEVMKTFADGSVDLILTDPPYGMAYQSSWRTDRYDKIVGDENLEWLSPFLEEAFRVLKDNRHIYLFCNDYAVSDFRREMKNKGFVPKRALVWVKNNHTSGNLEGDYGNKTEFIAWGHKGRRELLGKRDTNVISEKRSTTERHPTQKPIDLMMYFIQKSTVEGEVVLDPFLGSGTTALAAKTMNRGYIGIEIDPGYCEIARSRLSQDSLFARQHEMPVIATEQLI